MALPLENPFATRYTRPGAVAYEFPSGQSAAALIERLRANGWHGQIVGPHGSGKSTLLSTLAPTLAQAGRRVLCVELHDGQRRLPIHLGDALRYEPFDLVIVDGYEQLSRWSRHRLRAFCNNHRLGLLVTSHVSVGLPDLAHTAVDVELARRLVTRLLGDHASIISPAEFQQSYSRHAGNLRETLMDLYDLYEDRR